MEIARRRLLVGAALGAGLVVAWSLREQDWPLPLPPGPGEVAFDAWLRIAHDGAITLSVPQLEMGQGIATLLAQIAAVELGADWRDVGVVFAPVSERFANGPLAARWAEMWMPMASAGGTAPNGWMARRWAQMHRFTDQIVVKALETMRASAIGAARSFQLQEAQINAHLDDFPPVVSFDDPHIDRRSSQGV